MTYLAHPPLYLHPISFSQQISSVTVNNIHIFFYILYIFLLNKLTFLPWISILFIATTIFTGSGYF